MHTLEGDFTSWLHCHIRAITLAELMAHDIHSPKSIGCDKPIV